MVRIGGERRALARLEVHHVVAEFISLERQGRLVALAQDSEVDAEAAVGRLRDGLEGEVHWRAEFDQFDRVGDVGQQADLGRDGPASPQLVHEVEQGVGGLDAVGGRVDADHRVAAPYQRAIDDRSGDGARVVGRMVRLQSDRQPSGQAERGPEGAGDR